ncbi:uncharacterized protein Fot_24018 [Forsythia ovata]|uniref:Uncharacterized protein n=1 Tax=Forsythia ovata TaxID=205694 RepID=A0ABD1U504_9LAMI
MTNTTASCKFDGTLYPPKNEFCDGKSTERSSREYKISRKKRVFLLDVNLCVTRTAPQHSFLNFQKSLRTLRFVLIQCEHGNQNSGFTNQVVPSLGTGSSLADVRIEFNKSFRLPVTLLREISIKIGNGDTFQKNCLEFNLYESRSNKMVKGQLLGTAIEDLAEYGVVEESLSINAPINCKRTYKNTTQPLLFLEI